MDEGVRIVGVVKSTLLLRVDSGDIGTVPAKCDHLLEIRVISASHFGPRRRWIPGNPFSPPLLALNVPAPHVAVRESDMGPVKLPRESSTFAIALTHEKPEATLFHPAGRRNARSRTRVVSLGWRHDIA